MSVAFAYATLATIVCLISLAWFVRKRSWKWTPFRIIASIIMFPYLLALIGWFWIWVFTELGDSSGYGLTYTDAVAQLGRILPVDATDIDFSKHYHQHLEMDFTIAEESFLDWCRANNWSPTPIDDETTMTPLDEHGRYVEMTISSGYSVDIFQSRGDSFAGVVYDKNQRRAFYRYHAF